MNLGPHGEGYCTVCHFIEPLDRHGRIAYHAGRTTGPHGTRVPGPCTGTGRRPPARTPYFSRLAMFRTDVPMVVCPSCRRSVRLVKGDLIDAHPFTALPLSPPCPGGGKLPPPSPPRRGSTEKNERHR